MNGIYIIISPSDLSCVGYILVHLYILLDLLILFLIFENKSVDVSKLHRRKLEIYCEKWFNVAEIEF